MHARLDPTLNEEKEKRSELFVLAALLQGAMEASELRSEVDLGPVAAVPLPRFQLRAFGLGPCYRKPRKPRSKKAYLWLFRERRNGVQL